MKKKFDIFLWAFMILACVAWSFASGIDRFVWFMVGLVLGYFLGKEERK
ncbi:MAG: hypothetical protein V1491_02040 [archaeon]